MAIPAGVTRVSLKGAFVGGDVFDTSFWVRGAVITSDAQANSFAASVATVFATHAAEMLFLLDNASAYQGVTVYHYPTGGPSATFVGVATIPAGTGTGAGHQPHQVCLVMTMLTAFAGRSNRGRMYWPATGLNLDGGLQVNSTVLATILTGVSGFIEAINTTLSPAHVVVVSTKLGAYNDVVQVKMDSAPDIQRRRANHLVVETVAVAAIT